MNGSGVLEVSFNWNTRQVKRAILHRSTKDLPEMPAVEYTRAKIMPPKAQAMPWTPTVAHLLLDLSTPITVSTVT